MDDLVRKTDWNGLKVETSLQVGHAGQQICERAEDCGADLIVTSAHGTTGLKHVLIGSTAGIAKSKNRSVAYSVTRYDLHRRARG
jgi:nucleotide-binding universal stress UspA family protein